MLEPPQPVQNDGATVFFPRYPTMPHMQKTSQSRPIARPASLCEREAKLFDCGVGQNFAGNPSTFVHRSIGQAEVRERKLRGRGNGVGLEPMATTGQRSSLEEGRRDANGWSAKREVQLRIDGEGEVSSKRGHLSSALANAYPSGTIGTGCATRLNIFNWSRQC
jgi:hypothetical protein